MTPDQAIEEAKSGTPRPIYLVVGEERFLQGKVVEALRESALAGSIQGLNDDQFVAGEATVRDVLNIAKTLPMMGKRRWILVRHAERWEAKDSKSQTSKAAKGIAPLGAFDQLNEYARDPSTSAVLVLTADKLDTRRKFPAYARKQDFFVQCDPLSQAALPRWVVAEAKLRGNPMSPSLASLMAESVGPELSVLSDALERVSLFVGEGQEITEDALAECVSLVKPATVWELVNAVGRRNTAEALRVFARVYDPKDRGLRLLGVLAWSTRQLLKFAAATRRGMSPPDAAKAAGAPPFKARELAAQLRHLSLPQLESWLSVLAATDIALKGGSKRPPRAILEDALITLCTTRAS